MGPSRWAHETTSAAAGDVQTLEVVAGGVHVVVGVHALVVGSGVQVEEGGVHAVVDALYVLVGVAFVVVAALPPPMVQLREEVVSTAHLFRLT